MFAFLFSFNLQAQNKKNIFYSSTRVRKIPVLKIPFQFDSLMVLNQSFTIDKINKNDYLIDEAHATITWLQMPKADSVTVFYRVAAINFSKKYFHKKKSIVDTVYAFTATDYSKNAPTVQKFVDENELQYNGAYGRSLAIGNNQDVVLNSNFNLQVHGYIMDSIMVNAAITDNSIPFQPEGNTQRLQEFDQVYIKLSKHKQSLFLGDFTLDKPPGYFMNFNKRVQGAFLQSGFNINHHIQNNIGISGSVAKGQFAKNLFQGIEGNQGPYKLKGNNGEQFFIVLANSEKVFINGQLLTRGENADYIINYNTGEVKFMPKMPINKDVRMQIEFEYQDKNYLNSLIYAYDELQCGKHLNFRFNLYTNQDAKNQNYQQSLTGAQKSFLSTIGDSIQNALFQVISNDSFAANKILYNLIDTVVLGIHYDSVFKYTTINDTNKKYTLSFTYVGENKGNYILSSTTANGRVYQWIAPIGSVKQGNYESVQLLITPKKQQLFSLITEYKIDSFKKINVEIAQSNYDPNLFSSKDNNTHKGVATKLNYLESRVLKIDSTHKWNVENQLNYEYFQKTFKPINPYRNVEFARDWNLNINLISQTLDEHWCSFQTQWKYNQNLKLIYDVQYLQKGAAYFGLKNSIGIDVSLEKINTGILLNYLNADDPVFQYHFFRPQGYIEYKFKQLNHSIVGAKYQVEHNAITTKISDTLNSGSFYNTNTTFYIKTNESNKIKYQFNAIYRKDFRPKATIFSSLDHSQTYNFKLTINSLKNHKINMIGTYRQLYLDDTSGKTTVLHNDKITLGRIEYIGNYFKNTIQLNANYEIGSGQEQKKSFVFIEVPAGQGMYYWIDYNGDGVQQTNEFEIGIYPDQKKYIKLLTLTNEYVKLNYLNFNQSLLIDPNNFWKSAPQKGIKKFISNMNDQFSLQISNRILAEEGNKIFNPLANSFSDNNIVSTTNSLNNILYFNRNNSQWGLDYNYLRNINKTLLSYGVEANKQIQNSLKIRWNLTPKIVFSNSARNIQKGFSSPLSDGRNYLIKGWNVEPQLSWLYKYNLRIVSGFKYENKKNAVIFGGQSFQSLAYNIDLRWSKKSLGVIQTKFSYIKISSDVINTSPISYMLLDALQIGSNYIWNLNWEQKISKTIDLLIDYDGRKPSNLKSIHTGRMTLRAIL